ncbi:MAG: signal peptidase I [Acutalibacteraceae bacterium]|nr:signal peptidase I [Acutalibacteraceae bacterium]
MTQQEDINKTEQIEEKPSRVKEVFEWVEVVVSAMFAVVIIFTLLFRVATIIGDSMENTFFEGQKVIITNWFYTPKAGDVVVVSRNAQNNAFADDDQGPIIKRVIATEGQQVNIDFVTGIVYVDGVALDEPYTKTPTNLKYDVDFPVYVPEGHIFCLGDNRNESLDSRSSRIGNGGMIDTRYVLGKVTLRILPLDKFGGVD